MTANASRETELAALLARLSTAQHELLSLLAAKRDLIVHRDYAGLAALAAREEQLGDELRACLEERERLLAGASAEGLPHGSLADLSAAMPPESGAAIGGAVAAARQRAHLIRHECLAQWVAVQRTVLHLAQMLEIIATGGRTAPTYGKGPRASNGGALIDQAV